MDFKRFSMHTNLDSFMPASAEEKEYMVKMRPSSTFFKDGVKRLLKDKVATVSFIIIVLLVLSSIFVPMMWPYAYDEQLGLKIGRPVDASYNNLSPFTYGFTEGERILGQANIHEIIVEAPIGGASSTDKAIVAAAKLRAEQILKEFEAGDRTEAAFEALKSHSTEGSETLSLLDIRYAYSEAVGTNDIGKNATDFSETKAWLWETTWTGEAVRAAGEVKIVEEIDGFHVIYFAGYTGETESVFPHIFGTDAAGRDYFIRIIYGMRVSLAVGFFASIIVLVIGMTVGSLAGYLGGKVDLVIMRIVDIIYSLPDMLMVILLAAAFKSSLGTLIEGTVFQDIGGNIISLFIVFALLYWVSMARLIRGQILSLREQEYVLAARAAGAKGGWIIRKHLIPNCISVIIISTALQVPSAIFTESYLSFIGLGINAPMPSLGSLANDALNGISSYAYRLVIPAVVISLIVLSLNLFGDGLRDAFDPKLKR
ncbi:MAG: ABC transporter permease [Clostridia bacterium]|nr:ABC transporter permease [Clostridia bacterium]